MAVAVREGREARLFASGGPVEARAQRDPGLGQQLDRFAVVARVAVGFAEGLPRADQLERDCAVDGERIDAGELDVDLRERRELPAQDARTLFGKLGARRDDVSPEVQMVRLGRRVLQLEPVPALEIGVGDPAHIMRIEDATIATARRAPVIVRVGGRVAHPHRAHLDDRPSTQVAALVDHLDHGGGSRNSPSSRSFRSRS
jgi:hypothetical protein